MRNKEDLLATLATLSNEYSQMRTLLRGLYIETLDQEESLMLSENMVNIQKAIEGLRTAIRVTKKLTIK